jgi:hypothetical protein
MPALRYTKKMARDIERAVKYTDPALNYVGETKNVKILEFSVIACNQRIYYLRATLNGKMWYEFEIGMNIDQICEMMKKLEEQYDGLLTSLYNPGRMTR